MERSSWIICEGPRCGHRVLGRRSGGNGLKRETETGVMNLLEGALCILTFFFFSLNTATPATHGRSQARGQMGASAASLHHSHSNAGSEPHL